MIEPTDEMVQLAVKQFLDAPASTIGEIDTAMREALAGVLAIVDRDYRLDPICRAELMPGVHCARPTHVRGDHESALPGGSAVKWS